MIEPQQEVAQPSQPLVLSDFTTFIIALIAAFIWRGLGLWAVLTFLMALFNDFPDALLQSTDPIKVDSAILTELKPEKSECQLSSDNIEHVLKLSISREGQSYVTLEQINILRRFFLARGRIELRLWRWIVWCTDLAGWCILAVCICWLCALNWDKHWVWPSKKCFWEATD